MEINECTTACAKKLNNDSTHHFGADVYIRELHAPFGYRIGKHVHSYDHFSILGKGSVIVIADGKETRYNAPTCILITKNVEHEIISLSDITWFCIHGVTSMEEVDDLDGVHIKKD